MNVIRLITPLIVAAVLFCPQPGAGQPIRSLTQAEFSNPKVQEMISGISTDSLISHIQGLVSFGSRCMFCENRRQVALWLKERFHSYGITDVVLDSCKTGNPLTTGDSLWQYNVVATISGASAPGEITILGAHWDSYALPDPEVAPGADDNASGVAVLMELARIIQLRSYHPESTLRLIAFAAEELTGTTGSGAQHYSKMAKEKGDNIRLMVNVDVVGYNVNNDSLVWVPYIEEGPGSFTYSLTAKCLRLYSDLVPKMGLIGGDEEAFAGQGFAVTSLLEYHYNPNMHTIYDSISMFDMNYYNNSVKASIAIILDDQLTPVPRQLTSHPGRTRITLDWSPSLNANILHYNLYRKSGADTAFTLLATIPATDEMYADSLVDRGCMYLYCLTATDRDGFESTRSNEVISSLTPMDRDLLVVKDAPGGFLDPDDGEINSFYENIFSGLPHDFIDAAGADTVSLSYFGQYRKVCWLSNNWSPCLPSAFIHHRQEALSYLEAGGCLLLSAFQPSYLIEGNTVLDKHFEESSGISRIFRIDSVSRVPQALLCGSQPAAEGYGTLHVDSAKAIPERPGHIMNIETLYTSEGTVIYLFDTRYDTTTNQGCMKGKPVGVEYLGYDARVITLSVPLYYLDSADARTLVEFVMNEKFRSGVGFDEPYSRDGSSLHVNCHPNPARDRVTVEYSIQTRGRVTIELGTMNSGVLLSLDEGLQFPGDHEVSIPVGHLPKGVYFVIIRSGAEASGNKLILY